MEAALRAVLIEAAGSPSLIGDRVYPLKLEQDAPRPAITYQVISGPRSYSQDGAAKPTTFRVQIDIWGDSYTQVRQVRDAILPAISGNRFEGYGSSAVTLQRIFVDNERDLYESALDQAGPQLYRKSLDLFVTAEQD